MKMPQSIYIINPKADGPTYHSAEVFTHLGLPPIALIADLSITTVAALVPADFEVTLCDEQIALADLDHPATFVGLTGKGSQAGRMLELAQEFRRRGKTVILGGPYASLSPAAVRPYADVLVRGEIETIAPQLFADLRSGCWQAEYIGDRPDLHLSPLPRWDMYPNHNAMAGCLQTSRGCPFECEFCDVIQYVGRRQRHKPVPQILAELDLLYQQGYHHVFIADDNFTAHHGRVKEILIAMRDWNNRQPDGRLTFSTQLSIDAAKHADILQLCTEAGITYVLIGLETPNEASLRETKKRQNVGLDLVEHIQRFLDYGIAVMGGLIVGFDADGLDIFERQDQLAMAVPVPIFMLGALIAPETTPLYARLQRDHRLLSEQKPGANAPWETNIVPQQMTRDQLLTGLRWLGNRLYHPAAFGQRVAQFLDNYHQPPAAGWRIRKRYTAVEKGLMEVAQSVCRLGSEEKRMFFETAVALVKKPAVQALLMHMMFQYAQIRYVYQQNGFWEPQLAEHSAPDFLRAEV